MTREEFIVKWSNGMDSEQLKNIVLDLDELLSLPPAEGAEAFVKSKGLNLDYVKGIQLFLNPKYTVIDLMTEFAAQQQPTAEGAEEIEAELRGYARDIVRLHKPIMEVNPQLAMDSIGNDLVKMFNRLAQRLADKMVSERLKAMTERCKKLEFMIENGLGWEDMRNDITMPHEL